MRHSNLLPERRTFLFLHGIGDSSLNYQPFLNTPALSQFNLLIPDLLGYGKSSASKDYSIQRQVDLVVDHIKTIEKQCQFPFNELVLIPHSMASIHAMLMCDTVPNNQIKGVINVEGSVTQYGSFISEAVTGIGKDEFAKWFDVFKETKIFTQFIQKYPSCRSYYASLQFCQPEALLQNALEIYQYCHADTGEYTNTAGNKFAQCSLPKVYCYGDKSLCRESLDFLQDHRVPLKVFHTDNHFVMQQCFDEFVAFIASWK